MGLFGSGFQRPALFNGIAVTVAGHDLGTTARGIDLHDVGNRLGVSRGIVGHDDPLRNVGCDGVVLQGSDRILCSKDLTPLYQSGSSCVCFICSYCICRKQSN